MRNEWTSVAPLTVSNGYSAAHAVLSGRIFVIGGRNNPRNSIESVERYDPSTDEWKRMAPLHHKRQGAVASALNGFIYVFGAKNTESRQSIERYDQHEDSWTEAS